MSDLVKRLREVAEQRAEYRRIAEFGPGGGNPHAKAEQHLEWKAADEIESLRAERDDYKSRWEQTGCTRHHAMEVALKQNKSLRAEVEHLQGVVDILGNWVESRDRTIYQLQTKVKKLEAERKEVEEEIAGFVQLVGGDDEYA